MGTKVAGGKFSPGDRTADKSRGRLAGVGLGENRHWQGRLCGIRHLTDAFNESTHNEEDEKNKTF